MTPCEPLSPMLPVHVSALLAVRLGAFVGIGTKVTSFCNVIGLAMVLATLLPAPMFTPVPATITGLVTVLGTAVLLKNSRRVSEFIVIDETVVGCTELV